MPEKLNTANNQEEMTVLVEKALARLTIARAAMPLYTPLEWFINETMEEV